MTPRSFKDLMPTGELMRWGLSFTAVSNIWLVILISYAQPGSPDPPLGSMWLALLCAAGVAIGMYSFGLMLNDLLDVRHDRTFAPDRPLASGRMPMGRAMVMALMAVLVSVGCSLAFGVLSTLVCIVCAAMVVFYNSAGRYLPSVGIITLGLIRAAHMLVGDPTLAFCWPVWLTLTHVVFLSAVSHRLERRRPALDGRELWGLAVGWAFWSLALLAWMTFRSDEVGPQPGWLWAGPLVAAGLFLVLAVYIARTRRRRAAGRALLRLGLSWLVVYDAAWLLGMGPWWAVLLVLALLPVTWLSIGAIGQLQILFGPPPQFRRDSEEPEAAS